MPWIKTWILTEKNLGFWEKGSRSTMMTNEVPGVRPTNTSYWFSGLYARSEIQFSGWEYFNTSQVRNMSHMFDGLGRDIRDNDDCYLESFDLSHFDLSSVTDMSYMLANLSYYVYKGYGVNYGVDVSDLDFKTTINTTGLLKNARTVILKVSSSANNLASDAFEGMGTSLPCTLVCPADFTPQGATQQDGDVIWKGGRFDSTFHSVLLEPYAELNGSTLTFYYDDQRVWTSNTTYDMNTGSNNPEWHTNGINITKVVFDPSFADARPTSCHNWFSMPYLNSITGLEYLNTSAVTDME